MLQTKIVQNLISYEKLTRRVSLSPPGVERWGIKVYHFWNNAPEWENMFTLGPNVAKSTDYIRKCFNQKFSKIKFPTKT